MASYIDSKGPQGAVFPDNAVDTSWNRLEPLITPEQLRVRHLFGLPLVSQIPDPITGKRQVMTDPMLNEIIKMAVSDAEAETGLYFFPTQFDVKYPFDRAEYESFGYFRTLHRPVASIEALVVRASNNIDLFEVPLDWVDIGGLPYGQINIIPLSVAVNATGLTTSPGAGGSLFLSILGYKPWIADFWSIKYTVGFPDGNLPRMVNNLIGIIAAMKILSMLAATFTRATSASLSIDGQSQSATNPGPMIFKLRIEELQRDRSMLVGKLKSYYGLKFLSSNV